jgi:hypothetical protein
VERPACLDEVRPDSARQGRQIAIESEGADHRAQRAERDLVRREHEAADARVDAVGSHHEVEPPALRPASGLLEHHIDTGRILLDGGGNSAIEDLHRGLERLERLERSLLDVSPHRQIRLDGDVREAASRGAPALAVNLVGHRVQRPMVDEPRADAELLGRVLARSEHGHEVAAGAALR